MKEELRKAEINKSSERIRHLYRQICKHPESGVESLRNYRWRKHWSLICHIKTFLEGKGLVADPEDENDNYYHITFSQFFAFLRHHGFRGEGWAQQGGQTLSSWLHHFARAILPEMLLRDIWKHLNCKYMNYKSSRIVSLIRVSLSATAPLHFLVRRISTFTLSQKPLPSCCNVPYLQANPADLLQHR